MDYSTEKITPQTQHAMEYNNIYNVETQKLKIWIAVKFAELKMDIRRICGKQRSRQMGQSYISMEALHLQKLEKSMNG